MRVPLLLISFFACLVASSSWAEERPGEFSPEQYDYFETSVRPLLSGACGKCHGDVSQHGGLRTDSLEGLLSGGDSGAAMVPGDVEASLLISAVRRTGDYAMPPETPLKPDQVAALERWIEMGAPWTPGDTVKKAASDARDAHWAFQPIAKIVPPEAGANDSIATPVDQFVQAKLREHHLQGSPPASRATLIRRVTYDLTGLPPTLDEVEAFVADDSPSAYQDLVDRLLASPAYGEHWARYWLDLARYSDTKGYVYAREERRFVHAWNYRDWVVQAFNQNLPYDEFLLTQLAADQYRPDDPAAQAGMGFITIGRRFLGNTHDIIDDRIDVVGRTTMGLTLACARCHDHKYDPIPTSDYYSLYGIFFNSSDVVTSLEPEKLASVDSDVVEEYRKRNQELADAMQAAQQDASDRVRARIADYLFAQTEAEKYPETTFNQVFSKDDIIPSFVHQIGGYLHRAKKEHDPVFDAWHRFAAIPDNQFEAEAKQVATELTKLEAGNINPLVQDLFREPPSSMREVADRYGRLLTEVDQEGKQAAKHSAAASLSPEKLPLWNFLHAPTSPCLLPGRGIVGTEHFYDAGTTTNLWKFRSSVDQWMIEHATELPHTVRLEDKVILKEPHVFRRGDPANRGSQVTRHFPTVIAGDDSPAFEQGSGRMQLAQGIVANDNPLTPRVWVNRIWQHHFDVGLVPTSSDFGTRAPQPPHQKLLDWLASELIESGWDTKHIHRQVVLSNTYRQSSLGPVDEIANRKAHLADPENRLLWKMNPHRLSFEELRDSMLLVSQQLDRRMGGPGEVLFSDNDAHHRRTLYGYVDRQFLPSVFRVFDFANPDLHIPDRSETTVPQQALFGLNHAFVAGRASDLATLAKSQAPSDPAGQVELLFQAVYQRSPSADERAMALRFLDAAQPSEPPSTPPRSAAHWAYGYGAVTEQGFEHESFQKLPHFTGTAWQGGPQWPDSSLGWAQLTADGGHAGNTADFAVVRRWSPSVAGRFTVRCQVAHQHEVGNGIRCWVISSRDGVLKKFDLHNGSQEFSLENVEMSDDLTLDFIVDINGNLNSDDFHWSIDIDRNSPAGEESVSHWNAQDDFPQPPRRELSPLEQLAQTLLLSNEFLFVD